jgi:hypothetical protein
MAQEVRSDDRCRLAPWTWGWSFIGGQLDLDSDSVVLGHPSMVVHYPAVERLNDGEACDCDHAHVHG